MNKNFEIILKIVEIFFFRDAFQNNFQVLAMNLAAPFIPKLFRNIFLDILPYVDILFGNESEADAFANANNYGTQNLHEIGPKIAAFPKVCVFGSLC